MREVLPFPDGPVLGRWDLAASCERADAAARAAAHAAVAQLRDAWSLALKSSTRELVGEKEGRFRAADVGRGGGSSPEEEITGGVASSSAAAPQPPQLNTFRDRGVALQMPQVDAADLGVPADHTWGVRPLDDLQMLEQRIWEELDATAALVMRVRGQRLMLPLGLLQLRPPTAAAGDGDTSSSSSSGSSSSSARKVPQQEAARSPTAAATAPAASSASGSNVQSPPPPADPDTSYRNAASDGLDVSSDPLYPLCRRAHKLSWVLGIIFLDLGADEGRQAFLELPSISGRLQLGLGHLVAQRKTLAAMAAVKGLQS